MGEGGGVGSGGRMGFVADMVWRHEPTTEKQAILAEPKLEERLRGALELIKEQVGGGVSCSGGGYWWYWLFHDCIQCIDTTSVHQPHQSIHRPLHQPTRWR